MHRDTGLWGLAALILVSICWTVNGHPGCPSDLPYTSTVTQFQGKCYQFVDKETSWHEARDYCWEHGGGLVMIPIQKVNEYIINVLNRLSWTNNAIWIGLNDKRNEQVWKWVTNTKFNFIPLNTSWGWNSPNGWGHYYHDCILMNPLYNWKWVESQCIYWIKAYRFICQYEIIMVGNPQPTVHNISRGASTNNPDDLTPTTANQELNQPYGTVEQNTVGIGGSTTAMKGDQKQHNTQLPVILGAVGVSGLLIIAVIVNIVVIKSCRNDNLYLHHTPMTNADQFTQHDGYLAPKSLMHTIQISDSYITTGEAKHEPPISIQYEAANENMCSSGYLSMNQDNVEDGYELPMGEPIYTEIPDQTKIRQ